jgi:hypothetical protein
MQLTAARGAPAADACRSYLLLRLHAADLAEPYLDAYGRAGGMPRAPILAWLPYLAAARLAEGVAGETERLLELATRPSRAPAPSITDP